MVWCSDTATPSSLQSHSPTFFFSWTLICACVMVRSLRGIVLCVSPQNDPDVNKGDGQSPCVHHTTGGRLVRIHKKQYHYLILTSLSYIGQGIIQTTVLHFSFNEFINSPLPHELILCILDKIHVMSWRWSNAVLQKLSTPYKRWARARSCLPVTWCDSPFCLHQGETKCRVKLTRESDSQAAWNADSWLGMCRVCKWSISVHRRIVDKISM
jgi:hypothetical protein